MDASRMEIFMSLLVAIQSTALQPVAGIVLNNMTGSLEPIIAETIAGLPVVGINSVPIIMTELSAYELLGKVDATVKKISTTSVHNIEAAQVRLRVVSPAFGNKWFDGCRIPSIC